MADPDAAEHHDAPEPTPATNGRGAAASDHAEALAAAMLVEETLRRQAADLRLDLEDALTPGPMSKARSVLLRIANVDRRDVVVHPDRTRYGMVSFFLCIYLLYATAAIATFLYGIGVGHGGAAPHAGLLLIALLVAACIVNYDRVIVGTSNPNLDALAAVGEDAESGKAIHRGVTTPVGRIKPGIIVVRVMMAVLIALFVTQALDNKIFQRQIDHQRDKNHRAQVAAELRDPDGPLARARQRLRHLHERQASYGHHAADMRRTANGFFRRAERSTRGLDPSRLRGCGGICARQLDKYDRWTARADQYLDASRPALRRIANRIDHQEDVIAKIPGRVRARVARDRGGLTDTTALVDYLIATPAAWFPFLAITLMLLLFDLAAVVLKLGGRRSLYEHRQALRQQLLWQATVTRALRTRLGQASSVLSRRGGFDAARTALDDALKRTQTSRAVMERADGIAVASVLEHLRGKPKGPDRSGDGSTPPPADPPRGPSSDERPRRDKPPFETSGVRVEEPRAIPQRVGPFGRRRDVPLEPGRIIVGERRWELIEKLEHQGGRSVTWRAADVDRDEPDVAIKVMRVPRVAGAARSRRREEALRELQNMDRLKDVAFAVQIVDQGTDPRDDVIWFATYYCELGSLDQLYAYRREWPLREVLTVALQIVDGLRMAATVRLVHRDLKPANVLVGSIEETESPVPLDVPVILIADWGMSHITDYVGKIIDRRPGGTLWYSAPDQFRRGTRLDHRDDLYSLGAVIWWLCTGDPPHYRELGPSTSPAELDQALREHERAGRRALLDRWLADVPIELADFVAQLLRHDRQNRAPQDVTNVWEWAEKRLVRIYETVEDEVVDGGRERWVGRDRVHDLSAGGGVIDEEREEPPERPMHVEGPDRIVVRPRRILPRDSGTVGDETQDEPDEPDDAPPGQPPADLQDVPAPGQGSRPPTEVESDEPDDPPRA